MPYNRYGLVLFLCWISLHLHAQKIVPQQDFGTWIGLKLEKKLPQNFALSLEQQLRARYNASKFDRYFAELGLKYKINKSFCLVGNLRYIHKKNDWQGITNQLRYNIDLQLYLPLIKKWRLSYRVRYQQLFKDAFELQQPNPMIRRNDTHRHRLKVRWKLNKVHHCYYLTELFVASNILEQAYLDQLRFSLGDKIHTKAGVFNAALGYEMNLRFNDRFSFFFIKLMYQLEL